MRNKVLSLTFILLFLLLPNVKAADEIIIHTTEGSKQVEDITVDTPIKSIEVDSYTPVQAPFFYQVIGETMAAYGKNHILPFSILCFKEACRVDELLAPKGAGSFFTFFTMNAEGKWIPNTIGEEPQPLPFSQPISIGMTINGKLYEAVKNKNGEYIFNFSKAIYKQKLSDFRVHFRNPMVLGLLSPISLESHDYYDTPNGLRSFTLVSEDRPFSNFFYLLDLLSENKMTLVVFDGNSRYDEITIRFNIK